MMRWISKGGANHLQELRHGAAWGVEAIDRLQTESGWDIRSGDILFYFTPTFTSLRYWAKATKSIPMFTTRLKEDQYKENPASLHSNHLSVPCIIKCIFGKSVQFSDVCNVLHCNFDNALESFAKWYLDPFGSDAMNEMERQRLFFPVHQFSLNRQADFGVESQTERDSQPARDLLHEARKRRRVGSGTNSNLDGPSLNPDLSANVQVQATFDEDPNRFVPNPPRESFLEHEFKL
ncbi:hypothetical protein CBS147325_9988 [Penicillium roqueforti]|nr:hypothetical protein CBS147325_9988 [Penicillium roqueforti]KAI3149068.1 hypothetical protein DTO046C5_9722 [Penicillium roqueforti]